MEQERKLIFAHVIVGNTYHYALQDWLEDIELASRFGIDGFALNVGAEFWQFSRVGECYEAAKRLTRPHAQATPTSFKLFLSFDMSSMPGQQRDDVLTILEYTQQFSKHPNQLIYKGGVVVSTFAGENSTFGFQTMEEGWQFVKFEMESSIQHEVHFVPSFFIDPTRFRSLRWMDGYFHWNGGWPVHLRSTSPRQEIHCPRLDSDRHYLNCLPNNKTYMAAVSPWFFTHYGEDSWNKNWIYRGDDHLLARRWEHLLSIHASIDIVQILSWNDYGESHYLAPPRYPQVQPNSHAWVDGFPHLAWLDLNAFYTFAFKLRRWPTVQEVRGKLGWEDRIWMWARPHLKEAQVAEGQDPVGRPTHWQVTDDLFWVQAFCTRSGTSLTISCGENSVRTYEDVHPGMNKFSHPMVPGEGLRVEMMRRGEIILICDSLCTSDAQLRFETSPKSYNFNAFVCMAG